MSNKKTLDAIKKYGMIFISAQPDQVYFHWQVKVYMHNFSKFGLKDFCYPVFGYQGIKPSQELLDLQEEYPNIKYYKDDRKDRSYIPSIRPHILEKFFKDHPDLGKNVFYHDADIIFNRLPPFEKMFGDDVAYLSDSRFNVGYKNLATRAASYQKEDSNIPNEDIINKMCDLVGISKKIIKDNQENTGGAQYLLKNIDATFFEKSHSNGDALFKLINNYNKKHKANQQAIAWIADMWAVLWGYWMRGMKTQITDDLSFCWGPWSKRDFEKHNIFHLAGVNPEMRPSKFWKADYRTKCVIEAYQKNNKLFDKIGRDTATWMYVQEIIEVANKSKLK